MSRTRPVILQIIPHLGAGGAEQGCVDVAAGLVKAGAKSFIVSNGGARVNEVTRAGTTHIDLPVHSKNPFIMWRNAKRLKKIIEKNGVDIVHARSRAPAWSAYEACRKISAHFMTTCHAPYNIHGKKLKKFYNSSIAHGERVIAISEHVADYLRQNFGLGDDKIRLIHRGVAPEKFHPSLVSADRIIKLSKQWRIPDGAVVILMPGRLTRWKGQAVLIEAMAKIERDDLFCVFIGSDQGRREYTAELEALIAAKNLGNRIRIMGHCDDMSVAYMISTIVVSASTDPEGFGRIAIESQAMGRITIATDHGGSKETIIDNETGFLVPPNDADALAKKIEYALSLSEEDKYLMAEKAMFHVHENFTRDIMVDKTLDVYAEFSSMSRNGILVIKLGALGDFIHAIGPMRAIRDHHKDASITLLTQKPYVQLAEKSGLFDEIMLDPKPKYNPLGWLDFRALLNEKKFARVYDLQNNDRTANYFRLFSPKPEWVGAAQGASHRSNDPRRKKFHAYSGLKNNLKLVGIDDVQLDNLSWLKSDVSRFSLPENYAILVTGSAPARPNKRWPAGYYRDLITELNRIGLHPVLLGSEFEKKLNEEIALGLSATDLSGRTHLEDLPALARGAKIAIGNDTGPMHIISLSACPSIFFYRSDESTIEKHGPQEASSFAFEAGALEDIKIEKVLEKIKEIKR